MTRTILALLAAVLAFAETADAGCSRPANVSTARWNILSADAQEALCRSSDKPQTARPAAKPPNWNTMNAAEQANWLCRQLPANCQGPSVSPQTSVPPAKPANWNLLNASQQAYWRQHGTLPPKTFSVGASSSISTAAPARLRQATCGRACGQPWTDEDFAAAQREIDRLSREIAELDRRRSAGSGIRRYDGGSSVTSTRIGPSTYYSDNNGVSGTATKIGPSTFYNFNNGVSGTATTINPFTFYNLRDRDTTVTGTTNQIGNFQFHNFSNGVNGSSTQIGGTTFHNFNNGRNCTSTTIGTFTYTNCN